MVQMVVQINATIWTPLSRPSRWEASQGIPEDYEIDDKNIITNQMEPLEKESVMGTLETSEIGADNSYLWSKDNKKLLLFPELVVDNKKAKGSKDAWPNESQVWIISKVSLVPSWMAYRKWHKWITLLSTLVLYAVLLRLLLKCISFIVHNMTSWGSFTYIIFG